MQISFHEMLDLMNSSTPILATFDNKPLILHCCPFLDKKNRSILLWRYGRWV